MENFGSDDSKNSFAKQGQAAVDKAADKMQGGIKDVQYAANRTGAALTNKVDELRAGAAPMINKVAGQAQDMARQGVDAGARVARQAGEQATEVSDSVIAFTKENPIKALAIAAASGALLVTLIKALTPSRD
ncbi:MAG: hypothetical protein NVS9B2_26450 [Steroidobacteraceae bacterium]